MPGSASLLDSADPRKYVHNPRFIPPMICLVNVFVWFIATRAAVKWWTVTTKPSGAGSSRIRGRIRFIGLENRNRIRMSYMSESGSFTASRIRIQNLHCTLLSLKFLFFFCVYSLNYRAKEKKNQAIMIIIRVQAIFYRNLKPEITLSK